MDINTLYGILLAIGLSIVIMFFQNLNRKKTWRGKVTKIKRVEDVDDDGFSSVFYKVYYRTDMGKKGKVNLPESLFESRFSDLEVGSSLIKEEGKDYPRVLDT